MSDSSEEEDLSRFREAVDSSFTKIIDESRGNVDSSVPNQKINAKSNRYLEESTHYNDVKVPDEMQKKIGNKISAIISRNVEFVDVTNKVKKHKIKGGVKLFSSSTGFLSSEAPEDTYTVGHNTEARKLKKARRNVDGDEEVDEKDKINSAVLTGDYVLSKEEIKYWKSRKKEKLYKYKSKGQSKVLTAID